MAVDILKKNEVLQLVIDEDFDAILEQFDQDPNKIRRYLTRLSFNPDLAHHANVMEAFKFLSNKRAEDMPEFFLEIIRRQIWSMNEEGANISWSAPDIVGAIIAGAPEMFGHFFSYAFCAGHDELIFRPGLVRAYDMIEIVDPDIVANFKQGIDRIRYELEYESK